MRPKSVIKDERNGIFASNILLVCPKSAVPPGFHWCYEPCENSSNALVAKIFISKKEDIEALSSLISEALNFLKVVIQY